MSNFFKDNEDLRWYFEHGIDWAPVVDQVERGLGRPDGFGTVAEAVEFYREVMESVGAFAATEVAPRAAAIDREGMTLVAGDVVFGPALRTVFDRIKRLDLHGLCVPRELGGLNAPALVFMLTGELFARADVSVMAHHGFHGGMAMAMLFYSLVEGTTTYDRESGTLTGTRFEAEIAEIIAGKAWGSMDLTEPDAGSDLGAIRSRGEQDEAGNWFVSGQKIFITSGHAKYHFVLARTEPASGGDDPLAGLAGLSLFLVRAFEGEGSGRVWHATFDRLEEKLGHHGSATVAITFDHSPAELIGARGDGFRQMLLLMNNARISVAFESLGLCEAAYRLAAEYAAQRPSMGKTIDRHELIAEYLDEMRTDIQVLRAMAVYGAFHEELAQRSLIAREHLATDETDRARHDATHRRHKRRARRVTPLAKYFGSELAVDMARRCIQIHGGVGYTREYGAEKLLRDAMVMPIYEGTSQIQCLMAMKDTLGGIIKNPSAFVRRMAQARWRSLSARDPLERRLARLQTVSFQAQQHLIQRTAADKLRGLGQQPLTSWPQAFLKNWDPKRDFSFALLHAERLTRILTDEVAAEILWEQACRHPERRELLARHLERAEPRARYLLEVITSTGERLLAGLTGAETAAESA